ncbi:MAG: LON peptidase substrate-binding domain-containing protein, partial [Clostridia bacterium]|nr:LON peptidase substrate-binding domain-containing protein [Clostridia bacterium]
MQTNVEPQFNIPTMALRGIVVYPKTVVHFDVVRKKSIEALNIAMAANRRIFLVTQRDISVEEPLENDLYTIGCVAKIRQIARVQGDVVRVLVEGCYRAELKRVTNMEPALYSDIVRLDDEPIKGREVYNEALLRNAKSAFDSYAHTVPKIAPDVIMEVVASDDIGHLADFITH